MLTRRRLIGLSGFAALSASSLARAAASWGPRHQADGDARFFVFVQMQGAWDPCLAFEPKDRDAVLPNGERQFDQPYAMNEVKEFANGLRLAPQAFPLQRFADRMVVVHGIDMETDNGHIVDAMMTGMQSPRTSNAPYLQAVLAKRHSYLKRCSVPHIYAAYDGQFLAGPYASQSIVASAPDFLAFLGGGQGAEHFVSLQAMLGEYQTALPSPTHRRTFGAYVDAVRKTVSVSERLASGGFTPPADATTAQGMGVLFGQLFAKGIVGSLTWALGSKYNFDTHSNHYTDHPLKTVVADVDALCQELARVPFDAETSVLDRTTVVLCSEYQRTPRLNPFNGKDHNFRTNTMVAFGAGVKPGSFGMAGARTEPDGRLEPHAALPVDLATGRPNASGSVLKAKNVWAGFGAIAGVDLSREFGADTAPVGFFA